MEKDLEGTIETVSGTTLLTPLQIRWTPKEDITAYELALCLPYLNRMVYSYDIDQSLPIFRHFEIIDHNK